VVRYCLPIEGSDASSIGRPSSEPRHRRPPSGTIPVGAPHASGRSPQGTPNARPVWLGCAGSGSSNGSLPPSTASTAEPATAGRSGAGKVNAATVEHDALAATARRACSRRSHGAATRELGDRPRLGAHNVDHGPAAGAGRSSTTVSVTRWSSSSSLSAQTMPPHHEPGRRRRWSRGARRFTIRSRRRATRWRGEAGVDLSVDPMRRRRDGPAR
jgi:hypothetical protein